MKYDIFNGDADGIIALLQLQLANPTDTVKVTGVKRDIQLMKKITPQEGDCIRVLDISMEKNMPALHDALSAGARVMYVDHHKTGDVPAHANLFAHIDLDANMCTSLIVSDLIDKQFHLWAITAAYGDNLFAKADSEADKLNLSDLQKSQLKAFGTYINYNGYGSEVADLHFAPEELYELLLQYKSPFDAINDKNSVYYTLEQAYKADMEKAANAQIFHDCDTAKVILLEDAAWARRVSGVLGNDLANQSPSKAHAVFTFNNKGSYLVSVRAPLNNKQGAVDICSKFATGGGRAAAAGINELPESQVEHFIKELVEYYK
ncbi:DHHA1 domain-containing protein [Pseudoalteromonas carrageenovora]|uniref:DHHA1 domain-containing protein n=1 Tax=Pseudoalteromonas carrageenovora TaxID=227 RepID=UPI0026E321A3|nr:DHHA1 domain-containing protein [Pseudoalteromonas carrageenovora]MDO6466455.1 DHHA1 domain-containing protein [Pseudoalteromonas carrageenovora]MDO6548987.1 DHHA1 domain-containing protein [Pseudoalteromonas carrageenovora]MDO6833549.1 DHHA1 domain-containing protein [Pseudoalteromonas carrageenovora]MDO6837804.1 DHHA1 domain-containing protein [Pseudoalteromonas carrageenovora]